MSASRLWTKLTDCTHALKEIEIQRFFDEWSGARAGWQIAGVPSWLLNCNSPNRTALFQAENFTEKYKFKPDVFWNGDDSYVLELKGTRKGSELALTEVLHHAWKIGEGKHSSTTRRKHPTPVLVITSTDSAWLRAALSYLFHYCLAEDALKHLEITSLTSPDGNRFFWIDEPFARWIPTDQPPPCLPANWLVGAHCYRVDGSQSWVLTETEIKNPRSIDIVPSPIVMVSSLQSKRPATDYLVYIWRRPTEPSSYLVSERSNTQTASGPIPACPFAIRK